LHSAKAIQNTARMPSDLRTRANQPKNSEKIPLKKSRRSKRRVELIFNRKIS
jgi:hypothetical protein